MKFIRRHRPSPGTVLGVIAIMVALAGTAGALPGKNSVDSGDIKKNAVKSSDIARKAVKSRHIARDAVKGAQVKESTLGKVPRAADADNAANAGNATNAANAGAVDGHDATCPAGTFLHNGTCFDSASRFNSDWTGAAQFCADGGGYLPLPSELLSIRNQPGIDLGGAGAGHWADARYQDAAVNEAMTVLDNGTLEGVALAGPRLFLCAFRLVR